MTKHATELCTDWGKEMLAIVWDFEQPYEHVCGQKLVKVETDYRPLEAIDQKLSVLSAWKGIVKLQMFLQTQKCDLLMGIITTE